MDAVADLKLCLYLLPTVFVKTLASGYCIIFKKKSYLVFQFLSHLNLVIEFLILRIWFLDFAQVLNRLIYHFFPDQD